MNGQISHLELLWVIIVFGVGHLIMLGIMAFQHRLMWSDYKRRHKINGYGEYKE